MRTTIDFPEDLLRRAKARAALDGLPLKELVTRCLEQGLRRGIPTGEGPARRRRSDLPVVRSATGRPLPDLTNAELYHILEEEEVGDGRPDRSS